MGDLRGVGVTPSFNQSSVSNNSTPCEQVDTSGHVFFMVIYSLMFVVGLILNGFTLKVYFCQSQQMMSRSVTIYLEPGSCDFLISLCLPIRIAHHASRSVPILRFYCNFGASAFYLNMYASILFMGYIAANRYMKIIHPLGTHILRTVRATHIISTVTWGFLLATMSTYITLSVFTQENVTHIPNNTGSCEVLHSKQLSLFYKLVHCGSAVIFLFVLVSLVFFYYSTSRRLSLAQQKQPASPSNKKLARSRRNMLVLVSVFCVCFVPYHLVRLPYAFLKRTEGADQVFFYLKELTIVVSVLNVCLDPFIYFIFCKAFRAQLGLKRAFSTTQTLTHGGNNERRSSIGQSTNRIKRKTSLSTTSKQTGVL
ncbi:P2Y purinoceptor 14 [Larimichthys crocea]|uniref:P2Y purinoceptor 14 n=1 Tax=Larimichthys crocea TaxID=215358 RepID=UPI000F5DC6C0|nr:P2Y purinoceptor 14 [Larimichthys crocea]